VNRTRANHRDTETQRRQADSQEEKDSKKESGTASELLLGLALLILFSVYTSLCLCVSVVNSSASLA
jgi:hypothetical protein